MNTELWQRPAHEIARLVAARTVSATEVVGACLGRISATNPTINAICTLVGELALARAESIDRRLQAGDPARDLEGVPFVAKDVIETAGIRTTFGSRLYEHNIPDTDAVSIQRL